MRKISIFVLVATLLVLTVGCEDESSCDGQFGCACRANGSCDPGFVCSDGICVQYTTPPAVTADTGVVPPPQDSGSTAPPPETETLPAICQPVFQQWDSVCETWEDELIQAVNERRAAGAECGAQGAQPPVAALGKNASLQCAARLNSKDVIDVGDVTVQSEQKGTATSRAQAAGYGDGKVAENVLTNRSPASRVVDTWMDGETSCLNIMNPEFTEIGAGCYRIPDANIATVKLFLVWTIQVGGPIVGKLPEDW